MLFRAVIRRIDKSINTVWIDTSKIVDWFNFNHRSYRLDLKAVRQVMGKDGRIKGTVEALYIEGNPLPIGSNLDAEDVTVEHAFKLISESVNRPSKGFLDTILRR